MIHDISDGRIRHLYKITNKINKKIYIGQTVQPQQRWYDHKQAAKNNPQQIIHKAMIKYGIDNFNFEILASCKSIDDANLLETELVKQYDSYVGNGKGYNATIGGMNAPKTEEWKQYMRDWHKAHPEHSEFAAERLKGNTINLGKIATKESKQKMSDTMKQKCADGWMPITSFLPGSEATKYWKGKEGSNKGKITSEETRLKISKSNMGREVWNAGKSNHLSEETLEKMSNVHKGKHHSPSTEFKTGQVSPRKGKKSDKPAWNKGKTLTLSEFQIKEINQLKSQGFSLRQIEKIIGIGRHVISRELKTQE